MLPSLQALSGVFASMANSDHEPGQRFHVLVETIQEYAIYMLDPEGIVTSWNAGAERINGYKSSEIIGTSFERFFPADALADGLPRQILATAATTGTYKGEGWRLRQDGRHFWASAVITALRDGRGQLVGFGEVICDLTESRQHGEALRLERDRLRTALQSIADGVICTDKFGRIELMNPAAEFITGWCFRDAILLPVERVFPIIDASNKRELSNPVRACLASGEPSSLQKNATLLTKRGDEIAVHISATPTRSAAGEILGVVLVFQDATGLRASHDDVAFGATLDPLTLLPNRKLFTANLEVALQQVELTGGEQTLCFLDLHGLKIINDAAGRAAGDSLLQRVGIMLMRSVRSSDVVARLGGVQFAIILRRCAPNHAELILARILKDIEAIELLFHGEVFRLSASIGVTAIRAGADLAELMNDIGRQPMIHA